MKTIKNIGLFVAALIFAIKLNAQSIERSTFDIAGGVAKTDQFEVHYSLGQPFVKTVDLGDMIVSEGFIQGSIEEISTAVILFPNMEVGVSPNPTFDQIRINASEVLNNSQIQIFNSSGQLLLKKPFEQNMSMQISHFSAGTYFLNWTDFEGRLVRQFKIIKL